MSKTITYEEAFYWQIEHTKEDVNTKVYKKEALAALKSTHIECLDAQDVALLATEAGITPNEARRMMIHPEDANEAFIAEVNSFENDDTDDLFEYFS